MTIMRRIFICGSFSFPRSGATSNYVQYFGMALKECGYEVHIVSLKNSEFRWSRYKDLFIDEIRYRTGKFMHYMDFKTGLNRATMKCLTTQDMRDNDIVIVYSHNLWLHQSVRRFCKKKGVKVGAVVVEYFPKEEFLNKFDFFLYRILMKKVIPNYDFIFPISTYIEKKLSGGRAKQMVLPILADPYEYEQKEKILDGTRRFIFPANGKMKDALENMVLAIGEVLRESKACVEFHFCGVKKHDILKILKIHEEDELDSRIVVHDWLDYQELIHLYQKMDFLLLARDINEMTKANFPSKVPEVMTYGVIPIASKVGDYTKYYLNDNINSILMQGCNKEVIVSAIERALELSDSDIMHMADACVSTVTNYFDYRNWTEKLKGFLEQIYDNKN